MNVKSLIFKITVFACLLVCNSPVSIAGTPSAEWSRNKKFASLKIYVKSNRDNMPIGGAKVKIRRQARSKRDFQTDRNYGPVSQWYEIFERTNSRGELVVTDWHALTGSGRSHKATVKRNSPRPWTYLEIEVSATDFHSASETAWISFWEPNPTSYVYLSPR